MPGIIWLASYPKSGNTWLRAFLANLLRNPPAPVPINELPNFVLGDGLLLHYAQLSGRPAESLSEEEITRLRPAIHEWFARSRGEDVFVKTHNALLLLDGKPLITPSATAGAIYVIRNPMDVAISFAHHYDIPLQRAVDALCEENYYLPPSGGQVTQFLGSWSRHVQSWTRTPGLTLHLMRYEDMIEKPMKAFGGLVKFLGLPKDRPRLDKAIRFSSFRELKSQEEKVKFVESRPDGSTPFFRSGRAGNWRKVLSEAQVAQLVEVHGTVMREFGYLTPEGKVRA